MQKPPTFCGLNITRSIQDRLFLGLMGLLFMSATGYLLYYRHSVPRRGNMDVDERVLVFVIDEVILTIFLLSSCAFIWGVAAPKWIERFFEHTMGKFILMLALISVLLLGLTVYIISV